MRRYLERSPLILCHLIGVGLPTYVIKEMCLLLVNKNLDEFRVFVLAGVVQAVPAFRAQSVDVELRVLNVESIQEVGSGTFVLDQLYD